MNIDWHNPHAHITPNFRVHEALWLPRWSAYHAPTYAQRAHIQVLAGKMEEVREILGMPIHVHVWVRPLAANLKHPANDKVSRVHDGENYNALVGGAPASMHTIGAAVDFHAGNLKTAQQCASVREKLMPHLERLNVRMEDVEGAWIHIDSRYVPANGNRYFQP